MFLDKYSLKVFHLICLPTIIKCILFVLMVALLKYIITSIRAFMKYPDTNITNIAYLISAFEYDQNDEIEINEGADESDNSHV